VVFGAGGDRDPAKRPLMGAVTERLADRVLVTSDNPRGEDPVRIIDAIAAGMRKGAMREPDRARAIEQAVLEAAPQDVVLVAVTGSNGKTTVKEMLAAVLRQHAGTAVLATAGNLNNDIGVPLTLLRLRAEHRYCAIELGMNHRGEIGYLASLAAPTIALVNNAQREHLEFMGSVEEVADENSSVYDALPEAGTAIINADDAQAKYFRG